MILAEPMLETVRDILKENLTNITQINKSIRITNDRKVPPYAGEEFINLFGATTTNEYEPFQDVRKEVHYLSIGITRRLHGIPTDLSAEATYTYMEGLISRLKSSMIKRAYEIIELIDGQWSVPALIRQNEEYADYDLCILTPLGFMGSNELEEVYAEHFRLEDDTERPQALFLELLFGGMEVYSNKN